MLELTKQIIEFYTKFNKAPTIEELNITEPDFLEQKGSLFVTLYEKGEVRGSAGNIQDISSSLIHELIENTIAALNDNRFPAVKFDDKDSIKVRIDLIKERRILTQGELIKLDPVKSGLLAIKKDYEKMACILPNINHSLLAGEDFIPLLKEKLNEQDFQETDYILYGLTTETLRDF